MLPTRRVPRARPAKTGNENGFGVAEVLIAMFLLGLIAVAIIPILVQGLRVSVTNATVAAASQLANQQIEQVRGITACGSVVGATATTTVQSIPIKSLRTINTTCPAAGSGYPTTVMVSVSVTRTDTNALLATANTLVFVTGP